MPGVLGASLFLAGIVINALLTIPLGADQADVAADLLTVTVLLLIALLVTIDWVASVTMASWWLTKALDRTERAMALAQEQPQHAAAHTALVGSGKGRTGSSPSSNVYHPATDNHTDPNIHTHLTSPRDASDSHALHISSPPPVKPPPPPPFSPLTEAADRELATLEQLTEVSLPQPFWFLSGFGNAPTLRGVMFGVRAVIVIGSSPLRC